MKITILLAALLAAPASEEPSASVAEQEVRAAELASWAAFNRCDAAAMRGFFTEDAEFYHDRTGLTAGREAVVASFLTGPCSSPDRRIRRAPLPETVHFDPVPGFGAILTGEHLFYVTQPGSPERPEGHARFALVWKRDGAAWRMQRVLSYAHGPAPYVPPAAVALSADILQRHAGRYRSARAGLIEVSVEGDGLRLVTGGLDLRLRPLSPTLFAAAERDLRIEFTGGGGRSAALAVLENGSRVESAPRAD